MKRTIKLRAQEPEAPERKVRLRLPGRLATELEEYRDLYVHTHRHEIVTARRAPSRLAVAQRAVCALDGGGISRGRWAA